MTARLIESEIYTALKSSLTRATRVALRYVEEEIAKDPSPGPNRRELEDGAIVDYSADDLLVRYRRVGEDVFLELVLDERASS